MPALLQHALQLLLLALLHSCCLSHIHAAAAAVALRVCVAPGQAQQMVRTVVGEAACWYVGVIGTHLAAPGPHTAATAG